MNKCIIYLMCLLSLPLLSCSQRSGDNANNRKPLLTVSIEPLRNIVERIAGDKYDVVTVLDKGANPETFDPSMAKRAAAANSDIYFMLGAFPFEGAIAESGKNEAVNVAEGIVPIYGTHTHHHHEGCNHEDDKDPHTWTSFSNAKTIARNVAATLSGMYPDESDSIASRLADFISETDSLDAFVRKSLSETGGAFAIWHPSLSYFARDYNLSQLAVGQENKEVSPRRLKDIIEDARSKNVSIFFFQKEFDSRQAETIADQIGARLVTIDPLAYDWQAQILLITDELTK